MFSVVLIFITDIVQNFRDGQEMAMYAFSPDF